MLLAVEISIILLFQGYFNIPAKTYLAEINEGSDKNGKYKEQYIESVFSFHFDILK